MKNSSAFQVCSFRVVVPPDWSVPEQGVIIIAAGPDVSHGVTLPGLVASLGLELKHN